MMEVKRGDPVRLNLGTPLDDISRLTVQKDGAVILRYCSYEEKGHGCEELNSTRLSLNTIDASLTCTDADSSDEGTYEVEVIDRHNSPSKRMFNVTFTAYNFDPTPPFIHSSTTPDVPKNETTTAVNQGVIIGVTVGIAVLILAFIIVAIYFIYQRCKKDKGNHNNRQAVKEDCLQRIPLRSVINAASPNISIKMEDDTNHSEREVNHGG